jgi:hypothetical protein
MVVEDASNKMKRWLLMLALSVEAISQAGRNRQWSMMMLLNA